MNKRCEIDCEIQDLVHIINISYLNYSWYPPNIYLKVNKFTSYNGIEFYYIFNLFSKDYITSEEYNEVKLSVELLNCRTDFDRCLALYNKTKDHMIGKFRGGTLVKLEPNMVYLYAKYKDVIIRFSRKHIVEGIVYSDTLNIYINNICRYLEISRFYNRFGLEQEVEHFEYYDEELDETYYTEDFVVYDEIDKSNICEAKLLIEEYFNQHNDINKIINFIIKEEESVAVFNQVNRIIYSQIFSDNSPTKYKINIVDDLNNR